MDEVLVRMGGGVGFVVGGEGRLRKSWGTTTRTLLNLSTNQPFPQLLLPTGVHPMRSTTTFIPFLLEVHRTSRSAKIPMDPMWNDGSQVPRSAERRRRKERVTRTRVMIQVVSSIAAELWTQVVSGEPHGLTGLHTISWWEQL